MSKSDLDFVAVQAVQGLLRQRILDLSLNACDGSGLTDSLFCRKVSAKVGVFFLQGQGLSRLRWPRQSRGWTETVSGDAYDNVNLIKLRMGFHIVHVCDRVFLCKISEAGRNNYALYNSRSAVKVTVPVMHTHLLRTLRCTVLFLQAIRQRREIGIVEEVSPSNGHSSVCDVVAESQTEEAPAQGET